MKSDRNGSGQLLFLFFCAPAYIEQVIWKAAFLMKYKESQKEIIFFLAGFMLGVFYIYFMGDEKGGVTDFFSMQNLMQIRYIEVVQEEYFLYLVKKRCGILLLLGILSLAIAGKYLLQGFLMLLGCSMGSMLSVLIVRYGLRGMLLFFGFVFRCHESFVFKRHHRGRRLQISSCKNT